VKVPVKVAARNHTPLDLIAKHNLHCSDCNNATLHGDGSTTDCDQMIVKGSTPGSTH
jgi:hypothetical protein